MLIRITNRCTMGCSHCFIEGSGAEGEHMTWEVFGQTLGFGRVIGSSIALLSGGEPTEHPEFERYVRRACEVFHFVVITSNGLFALDSEKLACVRRLIDDLGGRATMQVTNDPRYYPKNLDLIRHLFIENGWAYENHLQQLAPCTRTFRAGLSASRRSPLCFNLRANVRRARSLHQVIPRLEALGRACTPSINVDGSVVAGEMDTCHVVGTVYDSPPIVGVNILKMTCRKCGLWRGLTPQECEMIGEEAAKAHACGD